MSGASIRIDATLDDAAVLETLGALEAAAGDLTPMWDTVGTRIVANTVARFREGKGPANVPWRPSIRARTEGGQTLIKSGVLRASVTQQPDAGGVTVGTNVPYAAIHQFGGTIAARTAKMLRFRIGQRWISKKSVTLPARPFLGLDDADRADILDIASDHLRAATGGAAT